MNPIDELYFDIERSMKQQARFRDSARQIGNLQRANDHGIRQATYRLILDRMDAKGLSPGSHDLTLQGKLF